MKPVRFFALAFLFLATAAFPAMEISLSSADAAFLGERTDDTAGHQISIIGDINNDSYDDFIITAPGWDQSEDSQNNGAAYLYYGNNAGFSGTNDLALADAIFIGNTGQEVAHDAFGIGDVDNDGYNDFAIGLKKYHAVVDDTLRNKVGKVYIFFGGPTQHSGAIYLESADASLEGTNAYAEAAHVKGVGDVNGDEYDDIIVGAGFHSQVGPEAGKTYLFLGKDRADWNLGDKMEDAADATFLAEDEFDWAGHRVAAATLDPVQVAIGPRHGRAVQAVAGAGTRDLAGDQPDGIGEDREIGRIRRRSHHRQGCDNPTGQNCDESCPCHDSPPGNLPGPDATTAASRRAESRSSLTNVHGTCNPPFSDWELLRMSTGYGRLQRRYFIYRQRKRATRDLGSGL